MRGNRNMLRAWWKRDLRGSVTYIQAPVHVHVGHHGRARIRRIPQITRLARIRRKDQSAVPDRRGESDELCPLENTKAFAKALGGPKQLIIYADARHSIGGVPSATNGPDPRAYQAKWVQARLAGKPLTSEYWFVEPIGRIDKTPLS